MGIDVYKKKLNKELESQIFFEDVFTTVKKQSFNFFTFFRILSFQPWLNLLDSILIL